MTHLFGISTLPHRSLIDRQGRIAYKNGPELGRELPNTIRQLIAE